MKVVYPTCCGIDVHKSFLVATIIKTANGLQPSYLKKRFSTFNSDIRRFKQWLLDHSCFDVCMESTASTGSPFLTSWRIRSTSPLPIPSG